MNYIFGILILLQINLFSLTHAAEAQQRVHGILIFLDDSEISLGVLSQSLCSAIEAENGPIIASASLLDLIHNAPDISPEGSVERYVELREKSLKSFSFSSKKIPGIEEMERITLSLVKLSNKKAEQWVIKEINASLYLLFPKKYLQENKINIDDVEAFTQQEVITETEQVLGLKVNHMKTVVIGDVKKPEPEPEFADYFIKALSSIFVINSEYPVKSRIPAWAIYIEGHGLINSAIVRLSLAQFKNFLAFLETKIDTKVLVYSSCYAAGTNERIIYQDAERGVDKTYPFPIITMALTDAPTDAVLLIQVEVHENRLQPKFAGSFTEFLAKITSSDITKYPEAIASISSKEVQNIPQIKYPGLPWFSVLDMSKVAIIDSIMAMSRTAPLDIATFFARQGKLAEPEAILLTAARVPFEIKINSSSNPTIVSMIPGDAVHYIKKILSTNKTVEDILNNFKIVVGLMPQKVFIVDTIEGKDDAIDTVVIVLQQGLFISYFSSKGQKYVNRGYGFRKADKDDQKQYADYLRRHVPLKAVPTQAINELELKVDKIFSQKISAGETEKQLIELLTAMPDSSLLHIKMITGEPCPSKWGEEREYFFCWYDVIRNLSEYRLSNAHKIIAIDKIEICSPTTCQTYDNVIIDVSGKGTQIFTYDPLFKKPVRIIDRDTEIIDVDYKQIYQKIFAHYEKYKVIDEKLEEEISGIEKRSVRQILTPEKIANIQETELKKQAKQKKEKTSAVP